MKKLLTLTGILAIFLCGCVRTQPQKDIPMETAPTVQTQHTGTTVVQQDMTAVAIPVMEETLTDAQGNVRFSFQGQAMSLVTIEREVAQKIQADFSARQAQFRREADQIKALSQNHQGDYPLFYNAIFAPGRADVNVLSLSGAIVSWSGGAHPDHTCIYANYNMVTGDILTLGSILTHADMADELGELVIEAIALEQENQSIWSGFEPAIRERFSGSISEDQAWYFSDRGLCFSFPPYELAPYSSGIVTVTVPYEKLLGIIDDGFFPVEQPEVDGSLLLQSFGDADMSQFDQIAEVIAQEGQHMVLLYTDTSISNVTIQMDHSCTIFYVGALTPGDAIMLEADLADHIFVVNYTSDGQTHSRYIQVAESAVRLLEEIPQ